MVKTVSHPPEGEAYEQSTISLSRFFHTLQRYERVILLALAAIMLLYAIVALAAYVLAPAQAVTSLPFRLDFDGADQGRYPNNLKFSTNEIVAEPNLLRVYKQNDIERFLPFRDFKDAVFIQDSSKELERLNREFESRLSDPRLTAVDRERIEREYQLRRESLRHADYSLNLLSSGRLKNIPAPLREKVLSDMLLVWAEVADREKGALKYRAPLLTTNVVGPDVLHSSDLIIGLDILRARIARILWNIDQLAKIPGADVVRVGPQHISLYEIRVNLEDIRRFRVEPLIATIYDRGLIRDPKAAADYYDAQLRALQRELAEAKARVDTMQQSMMLYMGNRTTTLATAGPQSSQPRTNDQSNPANPATTPEIVPQLSDSFLDKVVRMVADTQDVKYRQDLLDDINRVTSEQLLPIEKEETYYAEVGSSMPHLATMAPMNSAAHADEVRDVEARVQSAYHDVVEAVKQVSMLYESLSKNLNPPTELFTRTGPVTTATSHSVSLAKLFIIGVLVFLMSIPLVIVGCLIHARVREEDEEGAMSTDVEAARAM